jgi:hypothetical protein
MGFITRWGRIDAGSLVGKLKTYAQSGFSLQQIVTALLSIRKLENHKAAYFSLIGLPDTRALTWGADLRPAIARGRAMGIGWPPAGEGHNVRAWAELLVVVRALAPATAFAAPFALEVQRHGQRIEQLWRETLRYRKNYAYLYEVRQVRESTEWYLIHSPRL